jgi:uncharacterized damage-inducible protein DinB
MTISSTLLAEFDQEMASTRRLLGCVPDEQFAWRPHEKSYSLGTLANHLAQMPIIGIVIIKGMAKTPHEAVSREELLDMLDKNTALGREAIAGATDDQLTSNLSEKPEFAIPRTTLLRSRMLSHMIHHRGQLTVYLRLLNVPVPGMYGPSADDR